MSEFTVIRTVEEIDQVLNNCSEYEDDGTTIGGTYEQGVAAALNWLTEEDCSNPVPHGPDE